MSTTPALVAKIEEVLQEADSTDAVFAAVIVAGHRIGRDARENDIDLEEGLKHMIRLMWTATVAAAERGVPIDEFVRGVFEMVDIVEEGAFTRRN